MVDYVTNQASLSVASDGRIMPGVTIGAATNTTAVLLQGSSYLQVFGTIYGAAGVRIVSSGRLEVAVNASVIGLESSGVGGSGTGTILYNHGSVSGYVRGASIETIVNTGTIRGGALDYTGTGVSATTLTNSGMIMGTGFGAFVYGTFLNTGTIIGESQMGLVGTGTNYGLIYGGQVGVALQGSTALVNAGRISGRCGIEFYSDAVIQNSGEILSAHAAGTAIATSDAASDFDLEVDNVGTIAAVGANAIAINSGAGADTIVNRGRIVGRIALGGGADHYAGADGTISGVVALGAGDDAATGGAGVEVLNGEAGDDLIEGGGGDDVLDGGDDADTLIGGTGRDRMAGGAGNDTFYVDDARDLVFEGANGGSDAVYASVSYTLRAGQEIEALTADPDADLTGLSLSGNTMVQTITGDGGNNRITGGGGADTLRGLAGDDTYVVTDATAVVVEGADAGYDTVLTSVSYALAANVEALRTSNARGTNAIGLTGNALDNELVGNNGANVLDGGAGADTMMGGLGDDTYYVDNAGDLVRDGGGNDDAVVASVDYTLPAAIERLVLAVGGITGRGNGLANVIDGSAGDDVLSGRQGLDTLTGGAGADRFLFETGARAGDADTITDFTTGEDVIALDDAVFRRIGGPGALDARIFTNGVATTRDHRVLYDAAAGTLAFDSDGSGIAYAAVVFATVTPGTTLTAADIIVV